MMDPVSPLSWAWCLVPLFFLLLFPVLALGCFLAAGRRPPCGCRRPADGAEPPQAEA